MLTEMMNRVMLTARLLAAFLNIEFGDEFACWHEMDVPTNRSVAFTCEYAGPRGHILISETTSGSFTIQSEIATK